MAASYRRSSVSDVIVCPAGSRRRGSRVVNSDWKLGLEQTGAMEIVNGTRADMAAAVRRGADLRLFLVARGSLPFNRQTFRCGMQWLVADRA